MWAYTHMNQHTHIAHTLEKHRHTSKGNTPALGAEEGKDQGLSTQAKKAVTFPLPQKPHGT